MAAYLVCLVFVVVSALLHQQSEAVSFEDANRVLISYHDGFDNCKDITDSSSEVSKAAADKACEQAFEALDRSYNNNCKNWQNAQCRFIPKRKKRQCTCIIPFVDDKSIRKDIVKPFRECAKGLWDFQERTGVAPAPSLRFQQSRKKYDEALQTAHARRTSSYSHRNDGVGTSGGAFVFTAGEGSSRDKHPAGGDSSRIVYPPSGDSSRIAHPSGGASISRVAYPPGAAGIPRSPFPFTAGGGDSLHGAQFTIGTGTPATHTKKLTGHKQFPCPICKRLYSAETTMRQHLRCHLTDETKCPVCTRIFSTRAYLKIHMNAHHPGEPLPEIEMEAPIFGEREPGVYSCNECGRSYANIRTLREHYKSHTTLDTHCFKCKLTLATKQSYRYHIQRQHPEEALEEEDAVNDQYDAAYPLKCDFCNKRFKNPMGLEFHRQVTHGK